MTAQVRSALTEEDTRKQLDISETSWRAFGENESGDFIRTLVQRVVYDGANESVSLELHRRNEFRKSSGRVFNRSAWCSEQSLSSKLSQGQTAPTVRGSFIFPRRRFLEQCQLRTQKQVLGLHSAPGHACQRDQSKSIYDPAARCPNEM